MRKFSAICKEDSLVLEVLIFDLARYLLDNDRLIRDGQPDLNGSFRGTNQDIW